jgi:hypothetical protein
LIFRVLMVFGVLAILSDYAWTIAIFIYAAVVWFTFKTSDKVDEAKEHGVVCLQPQPYPDMSLRWNTSVRLYVLGEITIEELDSTNP